MDVEHLFFTTSLSCESWIRLRETVCDEYIDFCLGQWMWKHYNARDVSVLGRPHTAFLFSTQEKYVEFYLKWM